MKKAWMLLILIVALCVMTVLPAAAAGNYVYDNSGVLGEDAARAAAVAQQAGELSARYDCGIYIVIIPDYNAYGSSMADAAQNIFVNNGMGRGEDQSGVMLLVDTVNRQYYTIAHGYGNVAFTDYGKDQLNAKVESRLRNNDWLGAAETFVSEAGDMLDQARAGHPVDIGNQTLAQRFGPIGVVIGVVGIPCLIALMVCSAQKKKMFSVAKATSAAFYTIPNSLNLTESSDSFSHITETRVKVESDSHRSGGRGGTTINSSGFSGRGGSF